MLTKGMVILKKGMIIVLFAVFALALPLNSHSAVLINEILANGLNDPDSEWIELFNNESSGANLTNWAISETSSSNLTFNATIPARGFIVLAGNFEAFNSTYPYVSSSGIKIINITISSFNLADANGEVNIYNSSGVLADSIAYAQASGKAFENVSVGRYPDGSQSAFNLSTLTPGAKNDNQAPHVSRWINPSGNGTSISALANITINITDDTVQVNNSLINFNGTNFSMAKHGDIWSFLWNTSLNIQKKYNITVFFNDSYGKSGFDLLLNISVDNSPRIVSFSPDNLSQTIAENSTLGFGVNASDPDDALLNYSWLVDNVLNSTSQANFSYSPGFNGNGTHTINATVKDPSSNQASVKWTITATNSNRAPVLDAISNKSGSKNTLIRFNITAADLDNDTLSFSSNNSRISISKFNNSMATVSWNPTNLDLGSNLVNFTVNDGISTDSRTAAITIDSAGNTIPAINSTPITNATANQSYRYDADAADADNDTLFFSLSTNATGMSINSTSGLVAFNPSSTGLFVVNISVTDLTSITNQSFSLSVANPASAPQQGQTTQSASATDKLLITDVDARVDGKSSSNLNDKGKVGRKAVPGSSVEFKVTVKNDFLAADNVRIFDIRVKAVIEGIDSSGDLEEESSEFDLAAQHEKRASFKFDIPLSADEDTFDVVIDAEGESDNGTMLESQFSTRIEVEKKKHDLRLLNFNANPQILTCGSSIHVNYKIINLGTENEKNSVLEIKNTELNLDFSRKGISASSEAEESTFSGSLMLKISGEAAEGDYPITANVFSDDGVLRDTKTKEIKVQGCAKISEATESEVVLVMPEPVMPKNTKAIKEPIENTAIKISSKEENNMLLLALSTLIFTMFFVFTAIIISRAL